MYACLLACLLSGGDGGVGGGGVGKQCPQTENLNECVGLR